MAKKEGIHQIMTRKRIYCAH